MLACDWSCARVHVLSAIKAVATIYSSIISMPALFYFIFLLTVVNAVVPATVNRFKPLVRKGVQTAKVLGLLSGLGTTAYTSQYAPHLLTKDFKIGQEFWRSRLVNSLEGQWLARNRYVPGYLITGINPETGNRAIVDAVQAGDSNLVCRLLEAGADPNERDLNTGKPIIQEVVERGLSQNMLNALIQNGVNVNTECTDGKRPLDKAFEARNVPLMKLLLEKKAVGVMSYEAMITKLCLESSWKRRQRDLDKLQKAIVYLYRASGHDKNMIRKVRNNLPLISFNGMHSFMKDIDQREIDLFF